MVATFVVETGAGIPNANAYCDLAFANNYHDNFGAPADWVDASTEDKEAAIRHATRYLDKTFGARWCGIRVAPDQSLDWPRFGGTDQAGFEILSTVVPTAVREACAVGALLHLQGQVLSPGAVTEGDIASESKSLEGVGSKSVTYVGSKPATARFPLIERILKSAGLITGGGGWGVAIA